MENLKNIKQILDDKLINYYTRYYKTDLGIDNYQDHITYRLNEDDNYNKFIKRIKDLFPFFYQPTHDQKVLVDGAGPDRNSSLFPGWDMMFRRSSPIKMRLKYCA